MITAEVLCNVLNDLFGGVVYAGIDTDKYKYPIGKCVFTLFEGGYLERIGVFTLGRVTLSK